MHLHTFIFRVFSLFLVIFSYHSSMASHIVGGEISYKLLKYNDTRTLVDYEVTLNLYRDPKGVPYDNFASFGIFEQETWGAWKSYEVINNVPIGLISEVQRDEDDCKERSLNQERLQAASYVFEVTLEVVNNNYMISYQKCCRNFSITNIQGGGEIGSVYDVLITAEALRNGSSSPHFKGLPPIFICAGFELNIDNSAIDPDGDELQYKFCTPTYPGLDLTGPGCCGCDIPDPAICIPPYDEVSYLIPYGADNPMGNPLVKVDPNTGVITGIPEITGSYVVAVCIEEYRNGILLSKTRRDFEFNVVRCEENLAAKVQADRYLMDPHGQSSDSIAYFESCNDKTFHFINESIDEAFINSYTWQFFDESGTLISEDQGINQRDLNKTFPQAGNYTGLMILNDGATCYDTTRLIVNIVPEIDINTEILWDSCIAGPVQFSSSSTYLLTELEWNSNVGDGNNYNSSDFEHIYNNRGVYDLATTATDSFNCAYSKTYTFDWNPHELFPPDTIQIDTLLCYNDSIFIYGNWISEDGTYFDYLPSQYSGCDSIVERINVYFEPAIPLAISYVTICEEDNYFFNEQWYKVPGEYLDTLVSQSGCDSIIALDLSLHLRQSVQVERQLCEGDSLLFGNQMIFRPGSYTSTDTDINGCDSLTALTVVKLIAEETFLSESLCDNESYNYRGELIASPGLYQYNFMALSGCDSIVTLELELAETYAVQQNITICEGGIQLYGNDTLRNSGDYLYTFEAMNGCDSVVSLTLEVLPETSYEYRDTICLGETYAFGEVNISLPGIYVDTLKNTNGCDSLVILDLVVGNNLTRIDVEEELMLNYGESILLEPAIRGGDLISNEWSEVDEILSYTLNLDYLVEDDEWIYFESTNDLYCVAVDSVFIRSILEIDIYFPNIISPDGDGINDIFNIGASPTVRSSQLYIYDRWGNLIFIGEPTEDRQIASGWDGSYNNEIVKNGTYTYMVKVDFINGESKVYAGDVTVIR